MYCVMYVCVRSYFVCLSKSVIVVYIFNVCVYLLLSLCVCSCVYMCVLNKSEKYTYGVQIVHRRWLIRRYFTSSRRFFWVSRRHSFQYYVLNEEPHQCLKVAEQSQGTRKVTMKQKKDTRNMLDYNPKKNQLRYEFVFWVKLTRNFEISCSPLKKTSAYQF